MVLQRDDTVVRNVIVLYFSIIGFYSICVFFEFSPVKEILGFLRIPILMVLYFFSSVKKDFLYFLALLFYQAAYIFFGQNTETGLFLGAVSSVFFRLLLIIIICKAVTDQRWRTVFLTALPILFVYLYLIDLIRDTIANSYYVWMVNGFLTAFLGGLAVSNYCYKEDKKSYWLLISALLFVVQIGLFFVNKFYLKQQLFMQLIILLYGISHYTFYKFMVFKDEDQAAKSTPKG